MCEKYQLSMLRQLNATPLFSTARLGSEMKHAAQQ